jgi:hypothetical protein
LLLSPCMPSLVSVLLASALFGATPRTSVAGCMPRAELDLTLELPADAEGASVLSVLPFYDRLYASHGWIGLTVDDQLAVLVDLRVGAQATSPDPARPDPRSVFEASVGVGILGWNGLEI